MTIQPDDFASLSDRLEDEYDDDEIAIRCAISRKYYYVFHAIRENNWDHSRSYFNKEGDHAEASSFIKRLGYKDLADDYDDLRDMREKADYDLDEDFDDMDLAIFNNDVEDFVTKAKRENFIPR